MHRCTYLLWSRHGVYYFRAVLPATVRACLGIAKREIRVSLRTKDKARAKALLARRVAIMTNYFYEQAQQDLDFERRKALYWRGIELIEAIGEIDPGNEFEVDWLAKDHGLSTADCEAYLFALEHKRANVASAGTAMASQQSTCGPPTAIAAPIQSHGTIQQPVQAVGTTDETIERSLERFIEHKRETAASATAEKYGSQIRLFAKVIANGRPNLRLSEIAAEDMRFYFDTLRKLPRKTLPTDPRPIDEIVKSDGHRMAPKTLFAHAQATNMYLCWCRDQHYTVPPAFSSILTPLLKKPSKEIEDKEKAYSPDQLRRIFGCRQYCSGSFKRPSDFWVPLLGLFTGAREAELCQLEVGDIRLEPKSGIWLFDINAKRDKKLKNRSSKREVPIHPQLVGLGFLDYVAQVRESQGQRLFPNEERNKRGEFSAFSKRYSDSDRSRSGFPGDPDQAFRLIPISRSSRSRSACGECGEA